MGVARAPRRRPARPSSRARALLLLRSRLWPRAGGAPHCTRGGRRSVRGMGQRAASDGRDACNPGEWGVGDGPGGDEAQKEVLGVGDLACHPGRDCPAGLESRLLSSVASGLLSAAGRSGVRSARDGEGCKRQELPSSRLGKLPGLRAASRACTRNSRWSEFPGSGLAAPHVLLPGFAHPG